MYFIHSLKSYRKRKTMEFGQFNNEENENVSMGETDNSSQANEKHNDETTVVMNDN